MKIFFNRFPRREPYGGGNQFLLKIVEKLEQKGHKICYHLEPQIDLIFMMDPRPGDFGYSIDHIREYKRIFPKTKIIHRVNECDARKSTNFMDSLLIDGMKISDEVIFISEWLREYFENRGFKGSSQVIYNGCDLENFGIDDDHSVSNPIKVVTHHWSDNYMKGFDTYVEIDKFLIENPGSFEFTYVGRYWSGYTPKSTRIVNPLTGRLLGSELKSHDVYVTASRYEPCGMHHIEGAACGLPVLYHSETGGIKEMCKNHGLEFSSFEDFMKGLDHIKKNYQNFRGMIDLNLLDINLCCDRYTEIVEKIFEDSSFKC